jgi:hypothetical protein
MSTSAVKGFGTGLEGWGSKLLVMTVSSDMTLVAAVRGGVITIGA